MFEATFIESRLVTGLKGLHLKPSFAYHVWLFQNKMRTKLFAKPGKTACFE